MSTAYFKADPQDPVAQYNVKIPSENGLSYNSSQQIICHIDTSIPFLNPQQTYLKLNVTINDNGLNTHLSLDPNIGANVLIRTLRIVSGTGIELERIENYNTYVNLKYDYNKTPELESKRILLEGAVGGSYCNRSPINQDSGGILNKGTDVFNSLWGNSRSAEVTLPIRSGIFSSNHVFPNSYTQGLFIHLHLEEDYRCIRQNPRVRNLKQALRFQCEGSGDPTTDTTWGDGTTGSSFFLKPNINMNTAHIDDFPFKVGEKFIFFKADSNVNAPPDFDNDVVPTYAGTNYFVISAVEISNTNYIKVTIVTPYTPTDAVNIINVNDFMISVEATPAINVGITAPKYQVNSCELIVGALRPDNEYVQSFRERLDNPENGETTFEMTSCQTYTKSLTANHTAGTLVLPLNNTMAKALLCVPVNTHRPSWDFALNTKFMVGEYDSLDDYQFFYKNRFQPDRPVNVTSIGKNAVAQQQLSELRKALSSSDIPSLNLLDYEDNFTIGRAVALDGQVCDLNNQDVQLNLIYGAPLLNKNFHIFVIHNRDIVFTSSNMTIQV